MPDDENLFAPPLANVADPLPVAALVSRPRQVRHAVVLLWVSWVLTFPVWMLGAMRQPEEFLGAAYIVSMLFFLTLACWLNLLIYRGRNWARWVSLVFLVLSVAVMLLAPGESFDTDFLERLLMFADVCIEIAAMVLLFRKPGALWFRSSNGQSR